MVNARGGLIFLNREGTVGQVLTIADLGAVAHCKCRVVVLGARTSRMTEVGIEFLQPFANFWRLNNPPTDWAAFQTAASVPVAVAAGQPQS